MSYRSEDKQPVVCIPFPSTFPLARGANATSKMRCNVKTRVSEAERDLIEEEATLSGSESMSAFIRWCAVHVAKRLRELREMEKSNAAAASGDRSE